ncbi:hypothetical protein LOAG_13777 [Loa loa]|uniref:CRIB domain-containing protein n=1 Tax=Loa loa TaxID=7209 RepID=A0A1S0TIX8_LOALO|nr:hypothetical protein LOAG_13777 [Loa loa]EFO14739.1 hypothetical protein LOAG_13777 [Loa loa]
MGETESICITTDSVSNSQLSQNNSKKLLRKAAKVKPEEVSTPTHFEHLVHIEDLQSNANNFVATELSHDPIIRNIFNMIEKNIADRNSNAITVTTSTANDNITELCLESTMKNQECNPKNVAAYIHNIETYDNLNNFTIPPGTVDGKQLVQKRDNLKLDLKGSQKASDDVKSISYTLASDFEEKDNQNSIKNSLMLPKHKKLTPISSSDSTETISPVTPFTPTSVQFQYPDLKKQEAAYDAFVSRNTREITSSLYENQDMTIGTDGFEAKVIDFKDQMEIHQALKQLDDALDEQIPIGTSLTSLNSKESRMETFDENTESSKSKDSKKSVKQLVEMLDSKQLQFGMWNMPSKLHSTVTNQDSDFMLDNEGNKETKTPETPSKPSLIGVNIFGLNGEKSIAEIIAEKQNHRNFSLHKRPPTSPKPVLKKLFPIPKPSTSDEEEQKWLLPSSSGQAIHPSEKLISDGGRENMIVTTNKKPKIQAKHQITSNSAMLSTIIKVDDSESSVNSLSTMTDDTSVISTVSDVTRKDSSQQCLPEIQYQAVNHISENLNQNCNEKFLETSFDGPIAMTIINGNKNGTTKDLVCICDNVIIEGKVRMISFFHG